MKYLLNGVAIAAALAIISPAWAQNAPPPAGAPAPAAAAPAPAAPMGNMTMAKKPMMKKHRHMAKKMGRMGGGDAMTEQLNQQELARITGGGAPPAPAPAPAPAFGTMPASGQGQQPGK